jgi:CheY-like chemotaxis protein
MPIPYGPILVVEDVPNVLELLEVTLRFKGYPVITARNGQEALDVLKKEKPALVITDILMPKLDGYAFVYQMRTNPTPEDRNFAMGLGAARFIEKPIDTEEFLLTVAELLNEETKSPPEPPEDRDFYIGYRERLENKQRHKNTQIARTERLLTTLPEEQKPAFESLLNQARADRDDIQRELDHIYKILDSYNK